MNKTEIFMFGFLEPDRGQRECFFFQSRFTCTLEQQRDVICDLSALLCFIFSSFTMCKGGHFKPAPSLTKKYHCTLIFFSFCVNPIFIANLNVQSKTDSIVSMDVCSNPHDRRDCQWTCDVYTWQCEACECVYSIATNHPEQECAVQKESMIHGWVGGGVSIGRGIVAVQDLHLGMEPTFKVLSLGAEFLSSHVSIGNFNNHESLNIHMYTFMCIRTKDVVCF